MPEYLERLCGLLTVTGFDDLPDTVVHRAKEVIADTLGVIGAGSQEEEVKSLARQIAHAPGPATLIGDGRGADPMNAALINGTAGTFLELDEGNQFCRGHAAIHVVPAALAVAEENRLTGRDLILAIVLGYEVGARIGIACKLRMSMHPHGTWGTVAAAVGVGKLMGYDLSAMSTLINVSSSLGIATSRQTMLQGGTVRNVYSGVSNQMGLLAHKLVAAGFTGERDGLSTVFGQVVSDVFEPNEMVRELGGRYEIARNYFKIHACCRYNHSALDAMEEIAGRFDGGRIPVDRVASVDVRTYSLAAQLCNQEPDNMLAAKFSVPFALATYLIHGHAGVEAFRGQALQRREILDLAKRVTVTEDPQLTAMMPDRRPSRVTLTMDDGSTYQAETFVNRGDYEDPYSPGDLQAKFGALAEPVWGNRAAWELYDGVMRLDQIPAVNDLTAILRQKEAS